ncbi:MAG: SRPBCC family protein [Thiothrix sp.]
MESSLIWVGVALALIFLLLLPVFVGFLLSAHQQVTRVELFKAPADEVWRALSDLSQQSQWRAELKSMQMLDDDAGLRWVERTTLGGTTVLRKLKEIPGKELWLDMQHAGSKSTRHARLNAVPGGTRVTFVETQENRNPLGRIMARVKGNPERHLDLFVRQLKAHFSA